MPHHFLLLDGYDGARRHGRRRCHPLQLTRKAALAEEMAFIEHGDHGFLSGVRQNRQPHGAFLDIHDACGRIALSKNHRRRSVLDALRSRARPIECGGRLCVGARFDLAMGDLLD